jgi:CHAT domain-containing protein
VDDSAIEPPLLNLGTITEGNLSGIAALTYRFKLNSGQQVRIEFDKGDMLLQVLVCEPTNRTCVEFVSRQNSKLEVPFTAEVTGPYRLVVRSLDNRQANRPYRLQILAADSAPAQPQVDLAAQAFAEAEKLRARWDDPSLHAAIEKYTEAEQLWHSTGKVIDAVEALCGAGDVNYTLGEYRKALGFYKRALVLSETVRDQHWTMVALNKIGYTYIYLGEIHEAQSYATLVLERLGRLGTSQRDAKTKRVEAQALNNLGEVYYSLGDLRKSIDLFERALTIWRGGDRRGEALAHLNIGYSTSDLGDLQKAKEHYQRSLSLWQSADDRLGIALTQAALCHTYSLLGEGHLALEQGGQAATLFRAIGNRQGEAYALNSIATTYEDLGEYRMALDNYVQALRLYQQTGNRDFAATSEFYVARIHSRLGDAERALAYYRQSFELSRAVGQSRIEAYALKEMAKIYNARGQKAQALEQLELSLKLYRQMGNRRELGYTLYDIGNIYYSTGERQKALEYLQQASSLIRAAKDREGEALMLFNSARMERDRGNVNEALSLIKNLINIIESPRTKIEAKKIRTSYLASAQQYYELYIDLLMQLHNQHPGKGFDAEALVVSERARARSLTLTLAEEGIALRPSVDQGIARREQELYQLIVAKSDYQLRLLSGERAEELSQRVIPDTLPDSKHIEVEAREVERALRTLTSEYQEVRAKIRELNPRYASLTQPEMLRIEDIQREIQGDDTLLLEFALGDERSYLWVVSATGIESYTLPDRVTIENAARQVYELLTARQMRDGETFESHQEKVITADTEYWRQSAALSQMLLGPAAEKLATKRLLIVSDGALQYIPFEALPTPGTALAGSLSQENFVELSIEPLFLNHEIVGLPSANTLTALRRVKEKPASKMIAVLADPVFSKDDPRVGVVYPSDGVVKETNDIYLSRASREFNIQRLPSTRQEADAIRSLLPTGEVTMVTGFQANRAWLFKGELSKYRIVHFATHTILDSERPELSGIVMSLVDEHGSHQNGFLTLHDIYSLDLPAELVVLSASQTNVGRNIRGEGLAGLTHGFMYAGAKSTIGSLWQVDDRATSELMENFYSALLKNGATPAAALRAAKLSMWKQKRWHSPYFWAAFVLQGEYKSRFSSDDITHGWAGAYWSAAVAGLLLVFSCYIVWRLRKRRVLFEK